MKRFYLAPFYLAILMAPLSGQSREQKEQTARALEALQQKDGGFATEPIKDGKPTSSLRATVAAIRALSYFGGDLPANEECRNFVHSCFDAQSGGFADHPGGKPDVATTAVGMMAIDELRLKKTIYR